MGWGACPGLLFRLSPGVLVNIVYDHTGPFGKKATFLGVADGTGVFLIDGTVLYIPCRQIQAISLGN